MSEQRAILVSRDDIRQGRGSLRPFIHAAASVRLAEAFDAAVDQPRIRWCVEHGQHASTSHHQGAHPARYSCGQGSYRYDRDPTLCDCRVVDAIVVPLDQNSTDLHAS